jgi:hypothetical protein
MGPEVPAYTSAGLSRRYTGRVGHGTSASRSALSQRPRMARILSRVHVETTLYGHATYTRTICVTRLASTNPDLA